MPISVGDSLSKNQRCPKLENIEQSSEPNQQSQDRQKDDVTDSNNTGHWSEEENLLYMAFLNAFKVKFRCRLKKKKIRLFENMANFIKSRSAVQCRTHHQKYENKYGDVKTILRVFRDQFGHENYKVCIKWMKKEIRLEGGASRVIQEFKSIRKEKHENSNDAAIQVKEQDLVISPKVEQDPNAHGQVPDIYTFTQVPILVTFPSYLAYFPHDHI